MSSEPSDRGPQWLEHPAPPAGNDPGAARRRRLVALSVGGAVVAALVGLLVALPRSSGTRAPPDGIDGQEVLRPLTTSADPATGERTAAFDGFAVSVETEPTGALVLVAGVPRGEAPVLAGVDCDPGEDVEIRAEKAGFRPARAKTHCRSDTLVKLVVHLRR